MRTSDPISTSPTAVAERALDAKAAKAAEAAEAAAQAADAAESAEATDVGADERRAPGRPALTGKAAAPVIVKLPPPFAVRLSQIAWVTSLLAGAASIVYMFVIRQAQLPAIADLVRAVDATRAEATYTTAADIIFWAMFTPAVAILLVQVALLVSFNNRRPNVRWWLFGTVLFQGGVLLIARELLAFGERGLALQQLMLVQVALAVLGLLFSVLPPALRWSARQHDVRGGGPVAPVSDAQL